MTRRHAEKGVTPRSAARGARQPVPMRPQPTKHDGTTAGAELQGDDPALLEVAQLRRERDALKSEADELRKRVAELEANQAQVRNRLAWAIDSVQSVLGGKG
jgi:hypothetical protein